jgi:hypothetical protein
MKSRCLRIAIFLLVVALVTLACSFFSSNDTSSAQPSEVQTTESHVLVNPKEMFDIGGMAPVGQWEECALICQVVKASIPFARLEFGGLQFAFASSS